MRHPCPLLSLYELCYLRSVVQYVRCSQAREQTGIVMKQLAAGKQSIETLLASCGKGYLS